MTTPYWHLVRQDLIRAWPKMFTLIGVFTLWLLFLAAGIGSGPGAFSIVILQTSMVFVAVLIWRGIQTFGVWNTERMQLLQSLPVSGVYATGAAFFVLWIELVLYGLAVVVGAMLLSSLGGIPLTGFEGEALLWVDWLAIFTRLTVLIAIVVAILVAMVQFSWLLGRTFRSVHGPLSILTFLGLTWIFLRLAMNIGSWASLEIPFTLYAIAEGHEARGLAKITLNLAPLLGMLGLSGVLFWLGARLFEDRIEV